MMIKDKASYLSLPTLDRAQDVELHVSFSK